MSRRFDPGTQLPVSARRRPKARHTRADRKRLRRRAAQRARRDRYERARVGEPRPSTHELAIFDGMVKLRRMVCRHRYYKGVCLLCDQEHPEGKTGWRERRRRQEHERKKRALT